MSRRGPTDPSAPRHRFPLARRGATLGAICVAASAAVLLGVRVEVLPGPMPVEAALLADSAFIASQIGLGAICLYALACVHRAMCIARGTVADPTEDGARMRRSPRPAASENKRPVDHRPR